MLKGCFLLIHRLLHRFRLKSGFRLPVLLRGERLRLRRNGLRISGFSGLWRVILRLWILLHNRLLPWLILLLYRWLRVLGWLRITFWRWCNHRITGLRARRGLPGYGWGLLFQNSAGHGRCLQQRINRRAPGLRGRCSCRGGGYWLCHRMTIQQWIEFVIFRQRRAITRKQHIVRIGNNATGAVFNFVFIIHAFAGEQRRIGMTAKRVGKFLRQTLTTR